MVKMMTAAKLESPEAGISRRFAICDICSFGCLMECYIKDGEIIRVAPDSVSSCSRKFLCTKGYASRPYVYNEERIRTPLRRAGARGSGEFVPISWDEALDEIASRLNAVKAQSGAESVAFYSGYTKWYRFLLHRLAFSFGSPNYGTESSSCFKATTIANLCSSGLMSNPDYSKAGCTIAWGFNSFYSNLPLPLPDEAIARGMKMIIVDPKITPASQKYADIHLRPRPGTDGAVAHCLAKLLIDGGGADMEFIREHVFGWDEYAEMVSGFTPEYTEELSGVPAEQLREAAELIIQNAPLAVINGNAGIIHHRNGVQNYRAINALIALTGGFVNGSNSSSPAVDPTMSSVWDEHAFYSEKRPQKARPKVGSAEYPLWSETIDEFQVMALPERVESGAPYPVRALFCLGLNARMFPDSGSFFKMLEKLDFYVDVDIFLSDSAKYADIVLPACTSLERDEMRSFGPTACWRGKVIEPLYESRSDADIICELSRRLGLDDPVLNSGYEGCCEYLLRDLPFGLDELKEKGEIKCALPSSPLSFATPSGKYELYSRLIEKFPGLKPLPVYYEPLDNSDPELFPLTLLSGGRLPNAFASRFNRVSWARALRPEPMLDIHPRDAEKRGVSQGDMVELSTSNGSLRLRANLTIACLEGCVSLYHGYSEADVNSIIPAAHHDPYSGFPAYNSTRCQVSREADTDV